jgi:hypothetical protein
MLYKLCLAGVFILALPAAATAPPTDLQVAAVFPPGMAGLGAILSALAVSGAFALRRKK